jgi:hypothetical protein
MASEPKYDFSGCSITDEEMDDKLNKTGNSIFRPGEYPVEIVESKILATEDNKGGLAKGDKTWVNWLIKFENGEKKISTILMVPTSRVTYGAKESPYPFRRLKEFFKSIGIEVKISNLGETLNKYFKKANSLVGLSATVRVGYRDAHGTSIKVGDDVKVQIVNSNNLPLVGADNKTLIFDDYEAAAEYADDNNIAYNSFPEVLGFVDTGLELSGSAGDDADF